LENKSGYYLLALLRHLCRWFFPYALRACRQRDRV